MFNQKIFLPLIISGIMAIAFPAYSGGGAGRDDRTHDPKNVGVWMCKSTRVGSGNRPAHYIFRADGTAAIASGSNIAGRGYADRSGHHGEWKKTGRDEIAFKTVELLYNEFFHVSGRGFLNGTAVYNRADDTQDITFEITFTHFEYDGGSGNGDNGTITKENFDALTLGSSHCERLEDAFLVPFI